MRPVSLVLVTLCIVAGCAGPTGSIVTPTAYPTASTPTTDSPTPEDPAIPTRSATASVTPSPPAATFDIDGESVASVSLEVADTPGERRRGLMGRRSLARNHGMLFLFPDAAPRTFWMKNTHVPLDMIFIAANGTVRNVEHASPQPGASDSELRRYHSDGPVRYVIEVRRGFANRTGVGPGTVVRFHLPYSDGD